MFATASRLQPHDHGLGLIRVTAPTVPLSWVGPCASVFQLPFLGTRAHLSPLVRVCHNILAPDWRAAPYTHLQSDPPFPEVAPSLTSKILSHRTSRSQSHITTDEQSVLVSSPIWDFWPKIFFFQIYYLVFLGRPLWREVVSVYVAVSFQTVGPGTTQWNFFFRQLYHVVHEIQGRFLGVHCIESHAVSGRQFPLVSGGSKVMPPAG
jgi:hypothetical protein